MLKWAFEYKSPKLDEATHTKIHTMAVLTPSVRVVEMLYGKNAKKEA